jgi:DinB superfamily
MTKQEIIEQTNKEFEKIKSITATMDDTLFFTKPTNKWSVADNVKHLLISTNISALAFWLPKFLVRWIGGTPNRPSKTYDELVNKYTLKLAEGGVATGRFVPKLNKDLTSKDSLLKQWNKVSTHYLSSLEKNRTEQDLDNFLIKHPLLGKITLRELCYFTIYHTQQHIKIITTLTQEKNDPIF